MQMTWNQSDNYRWRYRLSNRGYFLNTGFFLQTLKNSNYKNHFFSAKSWYTCLLVYWIVYVKKFQPNQKCQLKKGVRFVKEGPIYIYLYIIFLNIYIVTYP